MSRFNANQKRERTKTGGGVPLVDINVDAESSLTENDVRIYHLMPPESIHGLKDRVKSGAGGSENPSSPVGMSGTSFLEEDLQGENSPPKSSNIHPRSAPPKRFTADDYYRRVCELEAEKLKENQRHNKEMESIQRALLIETERHNKEMERKHLTHQFDQNQMSYQFPQSQWQPQPWNGGYQQ